VIFHGDLLTAVGGVAAGHRWRAGAGHVEGAAAMAGVLVTVLRMLMIALPQVSLAVADQRTRTAALDDLVADAGDGRRGMIFHGDLLTASRRCCRRQSVARQVRVTSKVLPQWPVVLVTVLRMLRSHYRRCRWRWADQRTRDCRTRRSCCPRR